MISRMSATMLLIVLALSGCSHRVRTTHYLAVVDAKQQVPQELHRVTIYGYAPWYSTMKFGTGWAQAKAIDGITIDRSDSKTKDPLRTDISLDPARTFFEVGPSGISQTPQNHRFVAIMSADPDYFFSKVAALSGHPRENASQSTLEENRLQQLGQITTLEEQITKQSGEWEALTQTVPAEPEATDNSQSGEPEKENNKAAESAEENKTDPKTTKDP